MSYILEALRRSQAERERERGQVPGLDAQPLAPEAPGRAGLSTRWLLPAAGAALVVLLALVVWLLRRPAPAPVVVQAPTAPAVPAPVAPAPLPVVVSAPPVPVPAPAPVPASAPAPAPVIAPATPPIVVPPVAVAPSRPAEPRTVPLAGLTPEQRRELPPLVVSGSIWSDSAASRFVMLNGQIAREGDTVATGVVLERIRAKSFVLRWRELRVEVPL